jgi:hypothetical protein
MRPNRLQCGNTAAHTALLVVLPRDVLARPTNQEHEVDAAEEAKQVALYRYELTGELCDDDEIRSSTRMTSPTTENDLAEGDSRAAALRSLKRRLTRVVFHHLHTDQNNRRQLHHTVA